jgi:hypothetical protein
MFSGPDPEGRLDELQDELRRAQAVTPDLISMTIAAACTRITTQSGATWAARVKRLTELEAWTEAALVLVERELPQWKLRRLVYEEGAWLCSLSKQWNLPAWLGDCAEARHESLPLAILSALIEARQCGEPPFAPMASSVPQCGFKAGSAVEIVCCDNFA